MRLDRIFSLSFALLMGCPSPPESAPGPTTAAPAASGEAAKGGKGAPSADPIGVPPGDAAKGEGKGPPPSQKGGKLPPPVGPGIQIEHKSEYVPNAGKGTEGDPQAGEINLEAPQLTQDKVKTSDHYVVKGTVEGECEGRLRIEVLDAAAKPPPPGAKGGGPLSALDLSSSGAFSVLVPAGKTINLSAVCDTNNDGVINGLTDAVSAPGPGDGITGEKAGVTLTLVISGPPEGQ